MPKNGHGQLMKIAKHIGVNPVVVTQVLKGPRDFSEEQALRLTNYLGLNALESEFFMRLTSLERAGTHDLKQFHREAMKNIKRQAQTPKSRVAVHQELDEPTKSIFYSDWIFSAVRLLTTIVQYRSVDALAERLSLSRARVAEIVEFLINANLIEMSKGDLRITVNSTHVDASSRFVNNHRRNWRLKGLESINRSTPDDLFYSGPCAISEENFKILRSELVEVIASLSKRAPTAKPEALACMNIDWFKI